MRTKEEIWRLHQAGLHQQNNITAAVIPAMDEFAKETAIDFFKWNALKVDEYINYLHSIDIADGFTDKQKAAEYFEGAPISVRFDLYLQETSKR